MNGFIRNSPCHPVEGVSDRYLHSFGGELASPVVPPGGRAPCHLLFSIDTDDPLFPIRLKGTRILPLIYCPQYNAAAMSYRVENGLITVDWIERLEWYPDFPYDNYPLSFPRRSVTLLSSDHGELARLEQADEDYHCNETRFGGWHWLCQGVPTVECRNPNCRTGSLDVFGVVYNEPVSGVRLWDPDADWCDIEIIYQICSCCSSIQVCNRCT